MSKVPQPAPLRPLNKFQRARQIKPPKMEHLSLSPDVHEGLSAVALSVFTDMSNAGFSLGEAIFAVYLTGVHHGVQGS